MAPCTLVFEDAHNSTDELLANISTITRVAPQRSTYRQLLVRPSIQYFRTRMQFDCFFFSSQLASAPKLDIIHSLISM